MLGCHAAAIVGRLWWFNRRGDGGKIEVAGCSNGKEGVVLRGDVVVQCMGHVVVLWVRL